MMKRTDSIPAPELLEAYAEHVEDPFEKSNQREEFRRSLEGALLLTKRKKTLTGLVNTEPLVRAQQQRAQKLSQHSVLLIAHPGQKDHITKQERSRVYTMVS